MTVHPPSLPTGCVIRRATQQDQWRIRKLVLSARLDPTQLRWEQFWVIECQGEVIACGQLRNFGDDQELGSLVVAKPWRDRALGTALTQHLIAQATQPLYLECLGKRLVAFYTRFGFVSVKWQDLPRSLQLKFGLSQLAKTLFRIPVTIMIYRPQH
ncbi:MAG: GNAT family N-acetyltransferase [Halothece sp. Uz-M2-17]|nr:GNAT family N-acetyltransferase [Halothece sp. Uz-M2-17]